MNKETLKQENHEYRGLEIFMKTAQKRREQENHETKYLWKFNTASQRAGKHVEIMDQENHESKSS